MRIYIYIYICIERERDLVGGLGVILHLPGSGGTTCLTLP